MKAAMMSVLAAVSSVSAMELNQWSGKSLVKLNLNTAEEQVRFAQLADKFDLDVWNRNIDTATGASTVEVVSDIHLDTFQQEVVTPDLETYFADFFATEPVCNNDPLYCIGNATKSGTDSFYENYQRLDTIFAKMEAIDTSSELVDSFSIGTSFEGRDIRGFKITGASGFGGDKKIAVYNCGIHAREWIPPAFCVYAIETLAAEYGNVPEITSLLDEFEVHTIPIANPDGYEYSHTTNNNWRKSRKPNAGSSAMGTDLNRNFEFQWGTGGSSDQPSSDSYKGAAPFDNLESKALADYWDSLSPRAVVQMDIHATGNMWMYPMGYKPRSQCLTDPRGCGVDNEDDFDAHETCGQASRSAIADVNGFDFAVGPITWIIYQASGSTCDHAYGVSGIRWAYAIEVRGPGFQPNPSQIVLSNTELYAGIVAQMRCIVDY